MNNTEQNIGKCSQHQFGDLLKCLAGAGCQKHGGVLNRIPSSLSGREAATAAVQEETVTSQCSCVSDRHRQGAGRTGAGQRLSYSKPGLLHGNHGHLSCARVGNDSTSRAEKSSLLLHTCVFPYTYTFVTGVLFILQ